MEFSDLSQDPARWGSESKLAEVQGPAVPCPKCGEAAVVLGDDEKCLCLVCGYRENS